MEIWRDIKDYEGMYQVSNLGRVKSLARKVKNSRYGIQNKKERILKASINSRGYFNINLYNGKPKNINVAVLVAIAFLNHKPCGHKIVVDHINNISTDDRLENLQLISARKNCSKDRKGTSKYTGVSWHKIAKKWGVYISVNGKVKYLGLFTNELEASKSYQSALKKI